MNGNFVFSGARRSSFMCDGLTQIGSVFGRA